MERVVLQADGTSRIEEATPTCGRDFCAECGECLACEEAVPCIVTKGRHLWIMEEGEDG